MCIYKDGLKSMCIIPGLFVCLFDGV